MVPVNPESRSIVLRAAGILHFRILEVQAGEIVRQPGRMPAKPLDLKIQIVEVLKGEFEEAAGAVVSARVHQFPQGPGRTGAPLGPWSALEPEPGMELIAFSKLPTPKAALALTEDNCEVLEPAKDVLRDVKLAIAAEKSGRPPVDILNYGISAAAEVGYYFVEYIASKTLNLSLPDAATFDALARLMEAPKLRETPRQTLVDESYAKVVDSDNPDPRIVSRFALGLFRVLVLPGGETMDDRIVQMYLPRVLRLNEKGRSLKSNEVFGGYQADYAAAEKWLSQKATAPGVTRIRDWLRTR